MQITLSVAGTLTSEDAARLRAFISSAEVYADMLGRDRLPITLVVDEAGSERQSLTLRCEGLRPLPLPMARTTSWDAARI